MCYSEGTYVYETLKLVWKCKSTDREQTSLKSGTPGLRIVYYKTEQIINVIASTV